MKNSSKLLTAAALAIGAAFAAPATAQSSVTLYGLVDVNVGRYQLAGREAASIVNQGGLSDSFFGIRGSEDLGGGFRANVKLEGFIRPDSGEQGRFSGDGLFSKQATVGLSGPFGSIDLGRMATPLTPPMILTSPFGDSCNFNPSFMQMFTGGQPLASMLASQDTHASNAISYETPRVLGGLGAALQYAAGEVAGQNGRNRIGLNVSYMGRPLTVMAAAMRDRASLAAGETSQTTYFVGATYDFGVVKFYGQYARTDFEVLERDTDFFQLGASVPIGTHTVALSWARSQQDHDATADLKRNTITAGYVAPLSLRTDLYALAMLDRLTDVSNGRSLVIGTRHRF